MGIELKMFHKLKIYDLWSSKKSIKFKIYLASNKNRVANKHVFDYY